MPASARARLPRRCGSARSGPHRGHRPATGLEGTRIVSISRPTGAAPASPEADRTPLVGEPVFDLAPVLLAGDPRQHPVFDQSGKAVGEDVPSDEAGREFSKWSTLSLNAARRIRNDQRSPITSSAGGKPQLQPLHFMSSAHPPIRPPLEQSERRGYCAFADMTMKVAIRNFTPASQTFHLQAGTLTLGPARTPLAAGGLFVSGEQALPDEFGLQFSRASANRCACHPRAPAAATLAGLSSVKNSAPRRVAEARLGDFVDPRIRLGAALHARDDDVGEQIEQRRGGAETGPRIRHRSWSGRRAARRHRRGAAAELVRAGNGVGQRFVEAADVSLDQRARGREIRAIRSGTISASGRPRSLSKCHSSVTTVGEEPLELGRDRRSAWRRGAAGSSRRARGRCRTRPRADLAERSGMQKPRIARGPLASSRPRTNRGAADISPGAP